MQTVIGLFENIHAAQAAAQQLLRNGFAAKNIHMSAKTEYGAKDNFTSDINYLPEAGSLSSASHNNERSSRHKSLGNKIFRFFKNSFDNDFDAPGCLQTADRTGPVVTVQAYSVSRAERAVDILDEYGAVDVNETAADYGYKDGAAVPTGRIVSLSRG